MLDCIRDTNPLIAETVHSYVMIAPTFGQIMDNTKSINYYYC